jgi:hypothetical protein
MTTGYTTDASTPQDAERLALSKRIDAIGWGALLMLTGVIWLLPDQQVVQGTWLLATGVLLLALNAVRSRLGVGVSGLTTFLGAVALAAGLGEFFSIGLPLLAVVFIVVGATIILKPVGARKT